MPILHMVLFKLKPGVTEDQLADLRKTGETLVGQVPGLQSWRLGGVLPSTAHRAQGFDMAIVTVMDDEAAVLAYGPNPLHKVVQAKRLEICTDTIVYDMPVDASPL
ncbi:Dimeric alpha-beta barrel [Niveomyces insectorum RCEF 264]|uniref:Dimeric alpha-beta barrel n=1 Tax=Niveomyces insectorum RCEF 264 TaxID=1081102 RepID=A0A167QFH1_9HYPO|nr:Dimeric alpha-beta barrel [Niveomyces insectorum RCEF 264]